MSSSESDSDAFTFSVPASATSGWTAGQYTYIIYVTKDTDRFRVETGTVNVIRDYVSMDSYENRSWAERTLNAVNATLEGRASSDINSMTHRGRQISKMPIPELLQLRSQLIKEVNREKVQERLARGEGSGRLIRVRF
jgi:hypothetical protein